MLIVQMAARAQCSAWAALPSARANLMLALLVRPAQRRLRASEDAGRRPEDAGRRPEDLERCPEDVRV